MIILPAAHCLLPTSKDVRFLLGKRTHIDEKFLRCFLPDAFDAGEKFRIVRADGLHQQASRHGTELERGARTDAVHVQEPLEERASRFIHKSEKIQAVFADIGMDVQRRFFAFVEFVPHRKGNGDFVTDTVDVHRHEFGFGLVHGSAEVGDHWKGSIASLVSARDDIFRVF